MGVSSPPTVLSKSDASATAAAVTIACLAALPSFAGEASLELAADDVIEFILVSIAEANLNQGYIFEFGILFMRTYSVISHAIYLANAFPDATGGADPSKVSAVVGPSSTSVAAAPIRAAFPPLSASASGRSLSIHGWTSRKAEFLLLRLLPVRVRSVRAARLRPADFGGSGVIVGSHDCRQ